RAFFRQGSSENKLGSELDLAVVTGRRRNCPERSGAKRAVRIGKLRVIEGVEEFRPELEFCAFFDRKILDQRKVGIHEARSREIVPAEISEGERRGQYEGRSVNAAV